MKTNQTANILKYLESGNTITPIQALSLFNCFRLSSVVFKLKRKGYDIQTEIIEVNGKRFARYSLINQINNVNPISLAWSKIKGVVKWGWGA